MSDEPFASVDDLAEVWRPLTDAEETRAAALIDRASRLVRRRWSDVDDRVTAGNLSAADVADVVLEMVQSAMISPMLGVIESNQGAGPYSEGYKFDNPSGRLYLTASMIELFEGRTKVRMGWLA